MKFFLPKGATPLNPDEMAGLIPQSISNMHDLNAIEQDNILQGTQWAYSRKRKEVLTEKFLRDLHQKMFGLVWKWAGHYRTSNKTIGVNWFQVPGEILKLIENVRYWITNETYPTDEIAARFHHRLVSIHPFPNGNGRWARVMTDVLLFSLDKEPFTWGQKKKVESLDQAGSSREAYLDALQHADARDYKPLLKFARS